MNKMEIWVLNTLKDYTFLQQEARELLQRVSNAEYRITASYSQDAGGASGWKNSKVETLSVRIADAKATIKRIDDSLKKINQAVRCANLLDRERALIMHIINGGSLSSFARENDIYKSYVYKIRDNAVKKMARYIKTHFE